MNAPMASPTEPTEPRRMAWRVVIAKKVSTSLSHHPEIGVKHSQSEGSVPAAPSLLVRLWVALLSTTRCSVIRELFERCSTLNSTGISPARPTRQSP